MLDYIIGRTHGQHADRTNLLCRRRTRDAPGDQPGVVPWSEVESPREREKETDTEAHACPNRRCDYFEIRELARMPIAERVRNFLVRP
jgi:hypothetical protein